jgi:hypothetical protein
MYVTDISQWEAFGRAHAAVFADHHPAATMVEVRALIDPEMLIEIELDAVLPSYNMSSDSAETDTTGVERKVKMKSQEAGQEDSEWVRELARREELLPSDVTWPDGITKEEMLAYDVVRLAATAGPNFGVKSVAEVVHLLTRVQLWGGKPGLKNQADQVLAMLVDTLMWANSLPTAAAAVAAAAADVRDRLRAVALRPATSSVNITANVRTLAAAMLLADKGITGEALAHADLHVLIAALAMGVPEQAALSPLIFQELWTLVPGWQDKKAGFPLRLSVQVALSRVLIDHLALPRVSLSEVAAAAAVLIKASSTCRTVRALVACIASLEGAVQTTSMYDVFLQMHLPSLLPGWDKIEAKARTRQVREVGLAANREATIEAMEAAVAQWPTVDVWEHSKTDPPALDTAHPLY